MEKVQSEDPVERNVRRQLAAANIIQKVNTVYLLGIHTNGACYKSIMFLSHLFLGHIWDRIQAPSQYKNKLNFAKIVNKFPFFFAIIQIET